MPQTPRINLPYLIWAFPANVTPEQAPGAGFLLDDGQIAALADPQARAEIKELTQQLAQSRGRERELQKELDKALEANRELARRNLNP